MKNQPAKHHGTPDIRTSCASCISLMLCAALLSGVPVAGQATNVLTMKATLDQSTCTVDVDNANGKYTLNPTKASSVWGAKAYIQPDMTKITITLSKCGLGNNAKKPVLTVSGTKASTADLQTPNEYTFRDSGGTAKQFFIGIARSATPASFSSTTFYKNNDEIAFTSASSGVVGSGGSGEGAKAEVWVGVASGTSGSTSSSSDKSKARSGKLSATLTFSMAYK